MNLIRARDTFHNHVYMTTNTTLKVYEIDLSFIRENLPDRLV